MFSEPQLVIKEVIMKSLRNMRFEENLAERLANCVEGMVWDKFLNGKSDKDIELDFRVTFKDVTVGDDKREFMLMVNSTVGGKIISPEIMKKVMGMAAEPEISTEPACDCNSPKLFQEDKVHCAYCGRVIHE